jgi:DNA processing protein
MTGACCDCLRRSHLIAFLASRIAGKLDRPGRRDTGILGLDSERLIAAVAGTDAEDAEDFLESFDAGVARAELDERGTSALCRHSDGFPACLGDLTDPPAVLYVAGDPARLGELSTEPAVTIVGTRRPSAYGVEVAHALGRGLARAGVTVVSGLALGIDAAALRGAVEAGAGGLAVLAGGPDVPYPRTNRRLHAELVRTGAVLSEAPPGRRAFRWSFPARNRIMAALGRLTVVVEAAQRSGSLITTDFAEQLGRGVAAVPGRVTSHVAAGANRLLRDGAALVSGPEDVLDELFGAGAWSAPPSEPAPRPVPELRPVLEAVEAGEGIAGIGDRAGLSAAATRRALSRLESEGYVVRDALGRYERVARP